MADTVNIPKLGPVKKVYLYAGAAAVAGVVGYAYWRSAQAGADASVATGTGDDTSGAFTPGGGAAGAGDGFGGSDGGTDTTIGDDLITTNAQWYAKAYQAMAEVFDPAAVATALGKYLARSGLTPTEVTIVQGALAAAGNPPTGGPYATIPATNPAPSIPGAVTGVKVAGRGETSLDIFWTPVTGAAGYYVYVGTAKSGKVLGTSYTKTGLSNAKNYAITVSAVNSDGKEGPKSASVQGTTRGNEYPPAGLHAIDINRTDVQVGWNGQLAAVQGYNVYRGGVKIAHHLGTYHHDYHRKPNTAYKYQVTSVGIDGKESAKSAAITVRTKK